MKHDTGTAEGAAATGSRRRGRLAAFTAAATAVALIAAAFYAGIQVASSIQVVPTAATPSATAEASAAPAVDWASVMAFDQANLSDDAEGMRRLVAPGSPAARWLSFREGSAATEAAAGVAAGQGRSSSSYDEDAGTVTTTHPDGATVTTRDWITDAQGLVVSWSNEAGVPIADRLWTQNTTAGAAGQTITVTGAFLSGDGGLYINVDIVGDAGSDIDFTPVYVGPDGVAREPVSRAGPSSLTPGAVTKVIYVYDGAGFGGRFVYDAWNSQTTANAEITVDVR